MRGSRVQVGMRRLGRRFTAEVALVPPAQHAAPPSGSRTTFEWQRKFDVLALDRKYLPEEFEQWRLREGHFGGGYVFEYAATDLPARWPDAEFFPTRSAWASVSVRYEHRRAERGARPSTCTARGFDTGEWT